VLRRSLRSIRTSGNRPTPADGGPCGQLPPGEAAESAAEATSLLKIGSGPDAAGSAPVLAQGGLPDLSTSISLPIIDPSAVEFTDEPVIAGAVTVRSEAIQPGEVTVIEPVAVEPGAIEPRPGETVVVDPVSGESSVIRPLSPAAADTGDLLLDAQVVGGAATPEPGRPAQHKRIRKLTTAGAPRVGLVAVALSTATVAVLAAGTVAGLRSDGERARLGQASLVDGDAVITSLPDGRVEDVTEARENAISAAQAAQERARAKAAADAAAAAQSRQQAAAQPVSRSATRTALPNSDGNPRSIALAMLAQRGWSGQWTCLNLLWQRESSWDFRARNPSSGAYGIPQALPAGKMAGTGADWATNPATQIRWGLDYIASTYGTPCGAWAHSQATGWY
jgi:hypothetical protein